MKRILVLNSIFVMLLGAFAASAQDTLLPKLVLDTLPPAAASSTIAPSSDSLVVDLSKIKFSDDGLSEEVKYTARDSMWFDVTNKQVHLYGEASVNYTSLDIKAGYILLDYAKNEVTASMFPDSSGQLVGEPEFKDKDQSFEANKLRYNFKSKKGIIYEARTKQEDLYVLGEKAKFIGAPDTSGRNTIYNYGALITTCNADHPHFGVRTKKLKVIPDKLVVTGFSNVELAGIPTPLVLPFGFYPITKTRKAGLILPQDFNFSDAEGLGLQDFGWYQPINEHMDAKLLLRAFVNGSWGAAVTTNYNYKYKSSGNVLLRYNRRVQENDKAQKQYFPSFALQISHRQDQAAHPTRKIAGSVNIETNRDQNRNQNDFASVYRNQLNSNFTLNKIFPGKPYQFNLAFTHNQNTQTRKMNITLPEATFTLQRIYPFKRKNGVGKEQWYEKVSLTYNSQMRNSFNDVVDTLLFTAQTLRNARSGIQHRASTDFNMKLAKYINITPNISFEENWYPYIVSREFDPTVTLKVDSVFQTLANSEKIFVGLKVDSSGSKWGRDTLIRKYGFYQYRNYNAGVSASTSIFGTVQFKKGWLKGIRHKISPSASIGFGPDYSDNTRFFRTVETSSRPGYSNLRQYSIFDEGIYGRPSASARSMVLSYSLLNVLEIKHFSKRDTTGRGKKTKIFDNLNFSGNYNFSADSLRWSTVGTNGVFRFFKGLTTLNWRLTFDPYYRNERGTRVNSYNINNGGGLLRLDQFGINVNTAFSVSQIRGMIENRGEKDKAKPAGGGLNNKPPDDLLGWLDRFNLTHYITYERQYVSGTNRDTFLIGQHNLSLRGDIPVSAKWTVNLSNISYDFKSKSFVYPDLGITRDLHCWQMSLSWQPTRGTYFFSIFAKPGTFSFLKVPYRQSNFDGQGGF